MIERSIIFLALLPIWLAAQPEDIVLKAMKDELHRNLTELHISDFEKPFFIGYNVQDIRSLSVAASLGSIVQSSNHHNRLKNVRVLVGSYEFNDESLDANTGALQEGHEIDLPLDDDYYGIRRSLWITTDYVYKSAARQFKKNVQTVEEKKSKGQDVSHRRFAVGEGVTLVEEIKPFDHDPARLENLVRELSSLFNQYPDLMGSGVYLNTSRVINYMVNTEGTSARTTQYITSVSYTHLTLPTKRIV